MQLRIILSHYTPKTVSNRHHLYTSALTKLQKKCTYALINQIYRESDRLSCNKRYILQRNAYILSICLYYYYVFNVCLCIIKSSIHMYAWMWLKRDWWYELQRVKISYKNTATTRDTIRKCENKTVKERDKKYDENIIRNSATAAHEIIHMARQQVRAAHTFTYFSMTKDPNIENIYIYTQRPHVLQWRQR